VLHRFAFTLAARLDVVELISYRPKLSTFQGDSSLGLHSSSFPRSGMVSQSITKYHSWYTQNEAGDISFFSGCELQLIVLADCVLGANPEDRAQRGPRVTTDFLV
jgi:hypothetical protein